MIRRILLAACVLLCVTVSMATSGCKDITSYNAGLLPNIPYLEMRRARIIYALKTSFVDTICLQEVWFEQDLSVVLNEVKGEYPYHYSKIHYDVSQLREKPCAAELRTSLRDTPCTKDEATRLLQTLTPCIVGNSCHLLPIFQQAQCVAAKCADILRSDVATETCISCVFLHNPKPLNEALHVCSAMISDHNRINGPGLVVLSRSALDSVKYVKMFPENRMALERGYIQATLDDDKTIVCTHLSSLFPIYPEYDLPYKSYLNQSKVEINILVDRFKENKGILVGDFNTGPKVEDNENEEKNLGGEFPENYEILESQGYENPYLKQDGRCTFCFNNALKENSTNNVIDAVMYPGGAFQSPFAKRVLDEYTDLPMSDHFGVQVQVCDP